MKIAPLLARRIVLGLLAAVLLGALVFVAMRSGPLAPTRVTVARVADDVVTPSLFGIGTVEARRSTLIGPTAAGRVLRVGVDVGDTVKAGQWLAEMEPIDLAERSAALEASMARAANAVAAAQAQRQDAEARRSTPIGPTAAGRVLRVGVDVGDTVKAGQWLAEMEPIDLAERSAALEASMARAANAVAAAQAQRQDAEARRALASANARRYVDLGAKDFISSGAVEAKLQEQQSAEAAVAAAEANLAAARQDLRRLDAERAGLARQRENLRLLAPSAGVVISRDAEPGSTVVAGQAVLRLIDPASLWLRVRFDQGRSSGLAPGLPAEIVLRSEPSRRLAGKVARVEALSDSVTEERVAMITLDTLPAGVSVGELAEVTLALPATARGPVLPNASITRQGDELGVWQPDGASVRFVPVQLGRASLDGQVQVLGGVR
ncbi:MAG TPA: efflux RND transporter periplasmic adaptor subunit, partial [Albitalea sp.]